MNTSLRATYHRRSMTLQERLDDMRVVAPNGCWIWIGSNDGYGRITVTGHKVRKAHVVSYELNVGPIPEGMEIDHLCREPLCINWRHLEAVPHRENMLRATNTITGANAAKAECKRGHSFAEHGVRRSSGRRHCLVCERDYHKVYRTENRDVVLAYKRRFNEKTVLLRKRAEESEACRGSTGVKIP